MPSSRSIQVGDRVRVIDLHPAPLLTVMALYLEGGELFASCRWHKTAQLVAYPVGLLEHAEAGA